MGVEPTTLSGSRFRGGLLTSSDHFQKAARRREIRVALRPSLKVMYSNPTVGPLASSAPRGLAEICFTCQDVIPSGSWAVECPRRESNPDRAFRRSACNRHTPRTLVVISRGSGIRTHGLQLPKLADWPNFPTPRFAGTPTGVEPARSECLEHDMLRLHHGGPARSRGWSRTNARPLQKRMPRTDSGVSGLGHVER